LGIAIYGTLSVACQENSVLELFPEAGADSCSPAGAGGAMEFDEAEECTLAEAIVHRYSFSAPGARAEDSVGSADGSILNTMVATEGQLELEGADSDQYVDLPNGLIDGLTDATFEAWADWSGGASWQRIFDFGNSYEGEGIQGGGSTYLFLTPSHIYGSLRLAYSLAGADAETVVDAGIQLPIDAISHVAAVIDDTHDTMSLYLNGSLEASTPFTQELSAIDNVNNWLGRSQFVIDDEFSGTLYEFRIYRAALTEAQVAASYARGPDPAFLEP
jgi:hypothetical protein